MEPPTVNSLNHPDDFHAMNPNPHEQPEQQEQAAPLASGDGWETWDDESEEYEPETIDAEDLIQRRASPRKRAIQIGTALALALVIVLVLHSAIPQVNRPTVAAPAPTALNSPRMVAILSNVTYGTVTINGKRQSGHMPFVFTPGATPVLVTFDAPPFAPQTCRVSWRYDQVISWEETQNITNNGTCASG